MDTSPPHFSDEQLRYLNRVFPNRTAQLGMSLEEIWMEAGARKVVDHLTTITNLAGDSLDSRALERDAFASPARRKKR